MTDFVKCIGDKLKIQKGALSINLDFHTQSRENLPTVDSYKRRRSTW